MFFTNLEPPWTPQILDKIPPLNSHTLNLPHLSYEEVADVIGTIHANNLLLHRSQVAEAARQRKHEVEILAKREQLVVKRKEQDATPVAASIDLDERRVQLHKQLVALYEKQNALCWQWLTTVAVAGAGLFVIALCAPWVVMKLYGFTD